MAPAEAGLEDEALLPNTSLPKRNGDSAHAPAGPLGAKAHLSDVV